MSALRFALLADRGVVSVTGDDAAKLLQGLLTNDIETLERQPAIHAGLLSPQGKFLFEFFVVKAVGGFLLDVQRDKATELVKRLTMYKLRAKVEIRDVSTDHQVHAAWHEPGPDDTWPDAAVIPEFTGWQFPDPRLPALGLRLVSRIADNAVRAAPANAADYHAHRIGLGVPEGGKDYLLGDTFPHEALFDQLHGVSFTKGCYVGQEIVSRMEHRGTARKRVVPVVADAALPASGTEIRAGEAAIGTLGSTAGTHGLALIRLDRAAEAIAKGEPIRAGDVAIRIELPAFATFKLAAKGGEAARA